MNLTKKTKKKFEFLSTRLAPRLILAVEDKTNRGHDEPLRS